LPYDEPLPGILGEKVALTAYGTRYVTPKPPSAKTSTKGSSIGRDGGKPAVAVAAPVAARPPTLPATLRALSQDPSSFTTTSTSTLAGEGLFRPRSPSIDDLLRASGAAADEGEAICVDEGYGHDAMDHYDYGLARCGRAGQGRAGQCSADQSVNIMSRGMKRS